MKVRVFLAVSLAALMIACGRNNVVPAGDLLTPVAPSAAITTTNALGMPGREDIVVNMQDACDPDTFNEPLYMTQRWRKVENPLLETVCAEDNVDYFNQNLFPLPEADKPDF